MDIISRALAYKEIMHYRNSCYDCPFSSNRNGFNKCCHDLDEDQLIDIYLRESKQTNMNSDSIYVRLLKYCNGKECPDCIFEQFADTKNKHCRDLCKSEIREVFDIIDGNKMEDKTMERNEVIKSIEETEKKLAELKEQLKNCDEVPDVLDFKDGGEYYYVSVFGDIKANKFYRSDDNDMRLANHHNIFESKRYAEEYAAKMKFLGEMMHFKWLYDRDFYPDNNLRKNKWTIMLNNDHMFEATENWLVQPGDIYFRSKKIAERCADWLNKKYGYIKE